MSKITEIKPAVKTEADETLSFAMGKFESCLVVGYGVDDGLLLSTATHSLALADVILMLKLLERSLLDMATEEYEDE